MIYPGEYFQSIVVFIFGTAIGSFLNVVIYRIPAGISIVLPASHCPNCKRPVRPHENIPLISFLLLRGKCAGCNATISIKYPLIEGLMGLLAVVMFVRFGWSWEMLIYSILSALLLALSAIDLATYRLPNSITLTGAIIAVLLTVVLRRDFFISMLLGGLTGLGLLIFMGFIGNLLFRKASLGMGDIKLAGMIGLFIGPAATVGMFFLGVFLGALFGGGVLLSGNKKWGQKIPFGPYLAGGAVLALIFGSELWDLYMSVVIPG